jgi:DEAD/DEAH box helicase domain-containing protein
MPVFFDVETQNSFQEIGGHYPETDIPTLVRELQAADLVVGFNLYGFDYPVVMRYTDIDLTKLPTVDMMVELQKQLGFRVGLNAVASATLGIGKSADGLQAVQWWKEGRIEEIFTYCEQDVDVTRRVYEFGRQNRYVQYYDRQYRRQRVPVAW